jgi:hypothetical protein
VKSLVFLLVLCCCAAVDVGLAAAAVESPVLRVEIESLGLRLSPAGKIEAMRLADEATERTWTADVGLVDCQQDKQVRATPLPGGGVQFAKRFVHKKTKQSALFVERFLPQKDSIRWECEIRGEGEPWSTPLETRFRCDAEPTQFWTTWGDRRAEGAGWADPLQPAPWTNRNFAYGGVFPEKDRNAFSVPLASILDAKRDVGLSLVLSPEDVTLDLTMKTAADGGLVFTRANHRIGSKNVVRFAIDLVAHPADWRSGLGWMARRYPAYFDPPNPAVQKMGGCGAYSSHAAITDPERLMQMGFRVNWKASFDFPYMAMFIPPVGSDTEEWIDFKKQKTSIAKMRAHSQDMRRMGFFVLNYFNITECGAYYQFPPPPRKAAKDEDLWKDANDFLFYAMGDAILPGPDGKPFDSWEGCVAMDPGEKVYQEFLLEQARRHIERLPESSGICIDRMDWNWRYNRQRDDGVTWLDGKPARAVSVSWHSMMNRLGPLMHDAGKVIYGNPHCCRFDLLRQFDGIYDEVGDRPESVNLSGLAGINKPVMQWTSVAENIRKEPDAYFQRHLHLGAFLTAPLPGNDHAILPNAEIERHYLDYGPLLDTLRGKRWLLLPHVVHVEGDKALANVFDVPGGYVIPVTFGGKEPAAEVVLQNLPRLPGQKGFRAQAIQPGDTRPVTVNVADSGDLLRASVPLKRGCAMLLLRHTWIEPQTAYFYDAATVELGSTLEKARLHYTLDGSEPTPQSPVYSTPIELRQTTVVRAAAFAGTKKIGATLEREYAKVPPSSPVISPNGGYFDDRVEVALRSPKTVTGEAIRYTIDDTTPGMGSPQYSAPLRVDRSLRLRAVRFVPGGASVPATAEFRKRGPKPPRPDVALGELTPIKATVDWGDHPRLDRSIGDNPLSLGGTVYKHGIGVAANSEIAYSLKPEYARFVAVIGVDDAMRQYRQGTVVFEIQLDDRLVFSTFVMRPGDYTYVDLPIPPGTQKIRLLALSAGDGITCDHGNWAEAGFVIKAKAAWGQSALSH